MLTVRNLIWIVVTALATAAVAAPASALTVTAESGGGLTNVPIASASGTTIDFITHTGTSEISAFRCTMSLLADVDSAGTLTIPPADVIMAGPFCTYEPCPGVDWTGAISEPTAGQESLAMSICFRRIGGASFTCSFSVPIATTATHDYELSTSGLPGGQAPCTNYGGVIEIAGTWHITGTPIEIAH